MNTNELLVCWRRFSYVITAKLKSNLGDIASLRSGIYRKSLPEVAEGPKGEVVQLQKGHFDEEGEIIPAAMIPDLLLGDVEKHLLDGNEILLVAKGEQNTAYHLSEITVPIVASSLFLVIKVQSDKISPAYLAWYLNTSECQANLHKMSRGSAVRSLAKRDLQKLQVPVPSLEAQRAILNLYELQQKEQQILQRLLSATQQLAEAQLLQIAKHDTL